VQRGQVKVTAQHNRPARLLVLLEAERPLSILKFLARDPHVVRGREPKEAPQSCIPVQDGPAGRPCTSSSLGLEIPQKHPGFLVASRT
jgi:hypothetical protein